MATKAKTIKLGDSARDIISGFEGVVVAYCQHLTGCDTVGLKPQTLHEGKTRDERWFDLSQIKLVKKSAVKLDANVTFDASPAPSKAAKRIRETGGSQVSPGKRG